MAAVAGAGSEAANTVPDDRRPANIAVVDDDSGFAGYLRTFLALRGVRAADEPMEDSRYRRAAEWMIEHQNGDGGWGELPASYDESALRGVGPSTPSQTAWGLLSLLACGYGESEAARRGVQYLITTQNASGGWHDDFWTGTGFPKVFYLRYHLYATYFPLWALAEYRRQVTR